MPFARRLACFIVALVLANLFFLSACQTLQPGPTPTDLPTLPPPTGLAALKAGTPVPSTPTPEATATPNATATLAVSATASTASARPSTTPCVVSMSGEVEDAACAGPISTDTSTPPPATVASTPAPVVTRVSAPPPAPQNDPGPRSNATGFKAFSTGPVYGLGACTSITAPGVYLLNGSLTSQWDCLQIFSDNVVLDCQGNSLNGLDGNGYGVVVHHTSLVLGRPVRNVEIRNCQMSKHRYGIFVDAADNLYIHDNQTSDSFKDVDARGYGNFLGLAEGGGIRVNDTRGALISNNKTDSGAIGVDVRLSTGVVVRGNSANGNTAWGFHYYGVTNSEVSSNTSTNNIRYCTWGSGVVGPGCDAGGIMLQAGSSNNVVKNNTIAGQNGNGIFIKAHGTACGDSNTIANNKIIGAMYNAIEMSFCKNNKVQGNEISNSMDGIWMGFASNSEIDAGNYLHDLSNHGIISWNSAYNNVSTNRIVNSNEGLYFYWEAYDKKQFYFVPGEPTDHPSTANCLCSNTVTNNVNYGLHLKDSYKNQITGNTLAANKVNFGMEGNTSGNIIENNSVEGGAFSGGARPRAIAYRRSSLSPLTAFDAAGRPLSQAAFLRAISTSAPEEPFSLRWFKTKLRASLGVGTPPAPSLDLLSLFGL